MLTDLIACGVRFQRYLALFLSDPDQQLDNTRDNVADADIGCKVCGEIDFVSLVSSWGVFSYRLTHGSSRLKGYQNKKALCFVAETAVIANTQNMVSMKLKNDS